MFPRRPVTDSAKTSEPPSKSLVVKLAEAAAAQSAALAASDKKDDDFAPPVVQLPQTVLRRPRSENPLVFLEFVAGGRDLGRVTLELRADICPNCSENFRQLCTGERGVSQKTGYPLHYKGTKLHRIVQDKYVVGGDCSKRGDGTHSECAVGRGEGGGVFADENFILRHTGPGVLGMVNRGPNTNGSQFYITTSVTSWMDEKSVVFGCVVDQASIDTLLTLERLGTEWGATKRVVYVSNSGQVQKK